MTTGECDLCAKGYPALNGFHVLMPVAGGVVTVPCDVAATGVARPSLTFDELQTAGLARCEAIFGGLGCWSESEWGCALAGEVGEACNLLKKRLRGDDPSPSVEAVMDELADVVIYADLCASKVGGDLGEAVRRKFNQVSERRGSAIRL